MPLNRHHCIFYERAEDLWNLCVPLIHDNARAGFKWLYVADDHDGPNVQSALTVRLPSPVPAGEVVSARSLLFLDTPVSVNAIISQLRAGAQNALDEGFSGLFLLVEMTWSLRTPFGVAYLTEYEARLHELLSGMPLRTSCLYNRRVITEAMILDALRTHPGVYTADGLHGNPHFLPPAALLGGDSQAQLQYWMKAISPALAYCEKVLSIDPCAERAHQEMMRIFHLARRRDALERQYRLCTQALERYDCRAPAPATQALYQSLIDTL